MLIPTSPGQSPHFLDPGPNTARTERRSRPVPPFVQAVITPALQTLVGRSYASCGTPHHGRQHRKLVPSGRPRWRRSDSLALATFPSVSVPASPPHSTIGGASFIVLYVDLSYTSPSFDVRGNLDLISPAIFCAWEEEEVYLGSVPTLAARDGLFDGIDAFEKRLFIPVGSNEGTHEDIVEFRKKLRAIYPDACNEVRLDSVHIDLMIIGWLAEYLTILKETARRSQPAGHTRLEIGLKTYSSQMIKESIRWAHYPRLPEFPYNLPEGYKMNDIRASTSLSGWCYLEPIVPY
ncbi:hypothetical protein BV22DRAFT_1050146 [Leucogyrophana mollusca]|uniref:Uncharacterized protein n=1 Tax=Leucogyrophana mollusca TaxID=85980 RepID=A0ACB8B7J1_9AGAM|nr:hypothetical protein BV22DRAFT_1050146 [Leucogyrophana mollusca]